MASLSGKEDTWDNGEEKREEGEVFTLRVLIHYRKAEARSVTLSQWCHLYTTRKVTQHFTALLQTQNAHTLHLCILKNADTPICRWQVTDTNKHRYAYTYCTLVVSGRLCFKQNLQTFWYFVSLCMESLFFWIWSVKIHLKLRIIPYLTPYVSITYYIE